MPSSHPFDLGLEVERRGIKWLCHFTHLSSFREIAASGAVWSTQVLEAKRPSVVRNDQGRLDGHLNYISCSVQYPNLWVLDAYRNIGHRTDEWVVLLLKKLLVCQTSTRFSPVNAATASGAHVADGMEGLVSMFQPRPPANNPVWRRQKHAKSCPTDNQAEVLVHQAIFTDEILGVVCMTPEVHQQVGRIVDGWGGPRPETSVRELLFDSNYVKHLIWNGYEMDLPVRDEGE